MKSVSDLNTGIVVPCYNEQDRLEPGSYSQALGRNPHLTFLFVDDGSTDDTRDAIAEICEAMPDRALSYFLDNNTGKGEAVRQGMLFLAEKETYDIIGFWDADLAVPLDEIPDFIALFDNSDIQGVIGSRVHLSGRNIERINLRHYLGRIFATLISLTFNLLYYDTQCGAKLFRTETLEPVIDRPFGSRWIFDVELLIRISAQSSPNSSAVIYEMPVGEWKDVKGTKRTLRAYLTAIADFVNLIRSHKIRG